MLTDLITVSPDLPPVADEQQHALSAPLRRLALGLRCADSLGRVAVRAEFSLPPRLRLSHEPTVRDSNFPAPVASLAAIPSGARCHQLLSDEGQWRCDAYNKARRVTKKQGDAAAAASNRQGGACTSLEPPEWAYMHGLSRSYGLWSRSPTRGAVCAHAARELLEPNHISAWSHERTRGRVVVRVCTRARAHTLGAACVCIWTWTRTGPLCSCEYMHARECALVCTRLARA